MFNANSCPPQYKKRLLCKNGGFSPPVPPVVLPTQLSYWSDKDFGSLIFDPNIIAHKKPKLKVALTYREDHDLEPPPIPDPDGGIGTLIQTGGGESVSPPHSPSSKTTQLRTGDRKEEDRKDAIDRFVGDDDSSRDGDSDSDDRSSDDSSPCPSPPTKKRAKRNSPPPPPPPPPTPTPTTAAATKAGKKPTKRPKRLASLFDIL